MRIEVCTLVAVLLTNGACGSSDDLDLCEGVVCEDQGVCAAGDCVSQECAGPIQFADQIVEDKVRRLAGVEDGQIFYNDLKSIKELVISSGVVDSSGRGQGIVIVEELEGLQCLRNLEEAHITNTVKIADLRWFSGLEMLWLLDLKGNNVSDLSPLAENEVLEHLWLSHNAVENLSPIMQLSKLSELDLDDNQIRDLSPLVQNKNIGVDDRIFLRENPIDCDEQQFYVAELRTRGVNLVIDCP